MAQAPPGEACDALGPRKPCGTDATGEQACGELGCCWSAAPLAKEAWQPDVYQPACFYTNGGPGTYATVNATAGNLIEAGFLGNATLLKLVEGIQPALGPDLEFLAVTLDEAAPDIAHIKITDANTTAARYEVPSDLFAPGAILSGTRPPPGDRRFVFEQSDDPFSVSVTRVGPVPGAPSPGRTLFDTEGQRLVFKDQYLEISTKLDPGAFLYGAGERASETTYITRNGYPYVVWAADGPPSTAMQNSYSAWPFVLVQEQDGTAWGVLLLNSGGLEVVATADRLTFRAVGGVLDLYVLVGPRPLDVLRQLAAVVGAPAMQPYWALGFHQSRYGYGSLEEVQRVVADYASAGLPLEAIWTDIGMLDAYKAFTLDPETWPLDPLRAFLANFSAAGQHWVPIADPGIKVDPVPPPVYTPYMDGLEKGVFVKGVSGDPYVGQAWPGGVHWPDYGFNPAADAYWEGLLRDWDNASQWSGLWIAMNEVTNFCSGDVCEMPTPDALVNQRGSPPTDCQLLCLATEDAGLSPAQLRLAQPPYAIANGLVASPLGHKTLSVLATRGTASNVTEYEAHNLFGLTMARATYAAAAAIKRTRPFVLSRSTFPGSGAYAAHWTGDTNSTWEDLQRSVPGVAASGLAGIPMAGADVCGFLGNATEELCVRWVELGAWYPLMRAHSHRDAARQELYSWPAVQQAAAAALGLRYRLLPYFYTLLQNASETGHPLFRPTFLNYPQDPATFPLSSQFMLGDALLVAPVLAAGATAVDTYFPQGLWFNLGTNATTDTSAGGRNESVPAPAGAGAPAFIRGGASLTMQEPGATTGAARNSSLTLVVALTGLTNGTTPQPPPANATVPTNGTLPSGTTIQFETVSTVVNETVATSQGYTYNDDGQSLQFAPRCCNFLRFEASVVRSVNTTTKFRILSLNGTQVSNVTASATAFSYYIGTVTLRYGRSDVVPDVTQDCSSSSQEAVPWPALRGMRVFGWSAPVAEGRIEIGPYDPIPIDQSQFVVADNQLVINLDASPNTTITLKCPDPYTSGTFIWRSFIQQ